MIDEDWLKSLDFMGEGGLRFHGLAGIGASAITFIAYGEDGEKFAIKTRRHHLGFHIREIPLFMSGTPMYDVDRVNRKLSQLIGNDNFDEMTSEYDKLFDALVATFHNEGNDDPASVPSLGQQRTPRCPNAWPFLFGTPMMRRRLMDLLPVVEGYLPDDVGHNVDNVIGSWKRKLVRTWGSLSMLAPLSPRTLSSNPLFLWGAAVMDGFFTDDELPRVVRFVETTMGRLKTSPQADLFLKQITAVAAALTCVSNCEIDRLVKLCGLLGFHFDVHDQTGRLIASS